MYFSTVSVVSFGLLATSQLVAGHAAIIKAVGDAGGQGSAIGVDPATPRDGTKRNPFQQDATRFKGDAAETCGETLGQGDNDIEAGTQAVMTQNGATLPQVSAGGALMMTVHQVNGDGAGPYTCMIDATGTGTNWTAVQVTANIDGNARGRNNDQQMQDLPLTVAIPAGQACTGTVAGQSNVCMVRCENPARAGPFGGCVPIQMAAPAAPAAAAGTVAAAPAAVAPAAAAPVAGTAAGTAANAGTVAPAAALPAASAAGAVAPAAASPVAGSAAGAAPVAASTAAGAVAGTAAGSVAGTNAGTVAGSAAGSASGLAANPATGTAAIFTAGTKAGSTAGLAANPAASSAAGNLQGNANTATDNTANSAPVRGVAARVNNRAAKRALRRSPKDAKNLKASNTSTPKLTDDDQEEEVDLLGDDLFNSISDN